MTTEHTGTLEVDHDRGVIYFHLDPEQAPWGENEVTLLRICSLPKPIPDGQFLDITHRVGTSWDAS